jgi:uncharacterized damage-inducible protein DinB
MDRLKWFDRKFDFNNTENIFPMIMERLIGTPLRLTSKIRSIPPELLETKIDSSWSIKENIGHLTDLETLWQKRFDDIISGNEYMTSTDLANSKTDRANHNGKPVDELIREFSNIRSETLSMLENIPEESIFRFSLHPRLKTPMRTMDLFLFVAEHDDHHLARITAIEKQLRNTV